MTPSIVSIVRMTSPFYLITSIIGSVILIGLGIFILYNLFKAPNEPQNKKNETSRVLFPLGMAAVGAFLLFLAVRHYRKIQTSNQYAERIGRLHIIGALFR